MGIKHDWQTTRNRTASVSCSGPSLLVPGVVSIETPKDPLESQQMTLALEILRLKQQKESAEKEMLGYFERTRTLQQHVRDLEEAELRLQIRLDSIRESANTAPDSKLRHDVMFILSAPLDRDPETYHSKHPST